MAKKNSSKDQAQKSFKLFLISLSLIIIISLLFFANRGIVSGDATYVPGTGCSNLEYCFSYSNTQIDSIQVVPGESFSVDLIANTHAIPDDLYTYKIDLEYEDDDLIFSDFSFESMGDTYSGVGTTHEIIGNNLGFYSLDDGSTGNLFFQLALNVDLGVSKSFQRGEIVTFNFDTSSTATIGSTQEITITTGATELTDASDTNHAVATLDPLIIEFVDADADGDGYGATTGDCDDADAAINPSETEICDGIDNNCDGDIDEGGVCDIELTSADCGSTLNTEGASYFLSADLDCSSVITADDSYAFKITADDFNFDCDDNTITGSSSSMGYGVWLNLAGTYTGTAGVTVENCEFSTFKYGAYLDGSSRAYGYHTIQNNIFTDTYAGIFLDGSGSNTLYSNTIAGIGYYGIYLYGGSTYNEIQDNTISDRTLHGIYLREESNYNIVDSNIISDSTKSGIVLYDSSKYNTLNSNEISGSGNYAIVISDSDSQNNEISNNDLCDDNSLAFKCSSSSGITGDGNTIDSAATISSCSDGWPVYGTNYDYCS